MSDTLHSAAAIVGVFESPRRRADGVHAFQVQAECALGALEDAGLSLNDVDGLCTATGFAGEGGWVMEVCELAEYLGIKPTFVDSTDLGGAAPLSQIGHAVAAIATGLAEVVLVTYAGCPRASVGADAQPCDGPWAYETPQGFTVAGSYALVARRHMHEFGTTSEQLAAVAVQCRANAKDNPHARLREPLSVEAALTSPMIADPLRRTDCCVVTDSGGAVVVVGRERARDCRHAPASILGFGEAVGQMQMNQMWPLTDTPGAVSARTALQMADVEAEDLSCAQLYDSFTITALLGLEEIGICDRGEGGPFVEAGQAGPAGSLPINTDGGGLASNHPGRRGIFTVVEAVRQLRSTGPGVQLKDVELVLCHATGGSFSASSSLVLGR